MGHELRPKRRPGAAPPTGSAVPEAVIPCRGTRPSLPPHWRGSRTSSSSTDGHRRPAFPCGRPDGQLSNRDRRSVVEGTGERGSVERTVRRGSCQARNMAHRAGCFTMSDETPLVVTDRAHHRRAACGRCTRGRADGVTVLARRCIADRFPAVVSQRPSEQPSRASFPSNPVPSNPFPSNPLQERHDTRGHEQGARPPAARHRRVADEGAHHRRLPRPRVRGRGEPRPHPRPPAAERAARGHEEGPVRQVRGRRRQRLRGLLRRRRRQEEDGRRAEAGPEGRRRALPRDGRGPRGRGHRLAPARGAAAEGARCGAWSSTRSPARPSSVPCRTPATSTSGWSTRRRPGASSTACTATRSRRCCGARSAPGLSAGRVQSVATRLVVERERERMAFRSASYWDVTGTFAQAAGRRRPVPGRSRPGSWPSTAPGSRSAATSTTAAR